MAQETFAAALKYAERGLRVIPISPNSKVPPKDTSLTTLAKTPATREQLESWFLHTNNNIGALMEPSGLFLVDVDRYKDTFKSDDIIPTLAVSTHLRAESPRGGLHFYYKAEPNTPLADTQGAIPGVDTKYLGYVLLPPSKIDGKPYRWIEQGEPGIPPAFILRQMADRKGPTLDGKRPEALDLLSDIVQNGFTPGKHNEELRDLARLLARALNSSSSELKRQTYLELLKALDARDLTPQASEGHLLPTIESAWKYEAKKQTPVAASGTVNNFLEMDDLGTMAQEYSHYKLDYLIDNWLPTNAILLLAAPPESYKTWLLLDMAISLAYGDKDRKGFMGQFAVPNKATPVLIFQQEDFAGQVWQRMTTIMAQKLGGAEWNIQEVDGGFKYEHPLLAPIYLHNASQLSFENPDSMAMLERRVKETGAQVVFIDPLYSLGDSSDYFAKMALEFQTFKRIRKENNTAFVIAHHNRKSGGEGREQVYGSVLMQGASEGVILINKEADTGKLKISRSGKFFPGKAAYYIEFDIDDTVGRYEVKVESVNAEMVGKYDGAILELLANRPYTQKELATELDIPQPNVSRTLKRLKAAGTIASQGKKYVLGTDTEGF